MSDRRRPYLIRKFHAQCDIGRNRPKPIRSRPLRFVRPSKAKVTEDIKHEAVRPLRHISGFTPSVIGVLSVPRQYRTPSVCVLNDKRLSRSYSAVAEGELEIAAFALVVVLICTRKCTDRCSIFGPNSELPRLLETGVGTVDLSICIRVGKHDRIIGGTNDMACYV